MQGSTLPFSRERFFEVFAEYNSAIWPVQNLAIALGPGDRRALASNTARVAVFVVWSGHVYPAAPMFGVTPCPLVIFTFGMLLLSRERAPWPLLVIPALLVRNRRLCRSVARHHSP